MPLTDHVIGFEVTSETLRRHPNEVNLLGRLMAGLDYLYQKVSEAETAGSLFANEEAEAAPDPLPPGVRSCAFHWYATTVCDFVKMVGWLHKQQNPGADQPDDYLKAVVPALELWRNKVAAHSAVHTPHRKDTPADLLASLLPPTSWARCPEDSRGRLYAGALAVTMTRAGKTSTSQLQQWSLTKTHEELRERYGLRTAATEAAPVASEEP